MSRFLLAALTALALVSGAAAQTTTQVRINAKALWHNTGIVLHAGDAVTISAAGKWSWRPEYKVGPGGDPTDDYNAFDLFEPFDFFSQARLIAYIGDYPKQNNWGNGAYFPQTSGYISIGAGQTFVAPYGGKLWLGNNDASVTESTADNKGYVIATVTVGNADRNGPSIAITSAGAVYSIGQAVNAQYSCSDAETTVATCAGPVANGAAVDTATSGHYGFTVVATDANGNSASKTVSYVVADASSAAVLPTGDAFDPAFVGTRSPFHQFYLTNPQASPIAINGISLQGDYEMTGTNCGTSLGAHKTCRIGVVFKPSGMGTSRGELDITSDATVVPVPLWGVGVLAQASPNALNFPDQSVSTTSAAMTVTLTNAQPGFLSVKEIVVAGDYAIDPSTTCALHAFRLKMGHSCTIAVTFTPTAQGARPGTLVVHATTAIDPVAVVLGGNGVP